MSKAVIEISGQVNGNFTLRKHFWNSDYELKKHFNSFFLYFNTLKEARLALSNCYNNMLNNDYDIDELSFKKNESLYYDASKAIIRKLND